MKGKHLKAVRISGFICISLFLISIILGLIVAQFDTDGFNIIENDISDLGTSNHTPIPLLLDFGAMSMGILLIPMVLYINKLLTSHSQNADKTKAERRLSSFFNALGTLGLIVGLMGLFGLGLFSKDRTTELHLHANFAIVCFIGIISGGFFIGLTILFYPKIFSRVLGIYMIVIPPIPFFLLMFGQPPLSPIYEWIMISSIFIWLIPMIIIVSREINALIPPT